VERLDSAERSTWGTRQDAGASASTSHGPTPMDINSLIQRAPANTKRDKNGRFKPQNNKQNANFSRQPATPLQVTTESPTVSTTAERPRYTKLTDAERTRLAEAKACFYCRTANADHTARNCPLKINSSRACHPNGRRGPDSGRW
jgi:hypothetical protein